MNKATLKLSACLFGLGVSTAMADTMGLSLDLYAGANILGGASYVPYKAGDKDADGNVYTEATAKKANEDMGTLSSAIVPCGGLGAKFSYDFGSDGDEIVGLEMGLYGFSKSNKVVKEPKDKKADAKENSKSIMRIGVAVDPAIRIHAFRYEGGSMFFALGVDAQYSFYNNGSSVDNGEEKKFDTDGLKKVKKDIEDKCINPFNVAGKLGIGFLVMDNALDVRLNGRFWLMETVNRDGEVEENGVKNKPFERFSVGQYNFDLTLSIGYNFLA